MLRHPQTLPRLLTAIALALAALLTVGLPRALAADGTAELVIFHTNDMHARVKKGDDNGQSIGLAEMAAAVKSARAQNPDTLWLDAGDTFHGMPYINVSRGANMVPLLNAAGLDAMVPGNHDYDYGLERLEWLAKRLSFPVLSANTVRRGQPGKKFFKEYKIFRLPNNIRVGVFGLTTQETAYKTNPTNVTAVEFLNPVDAARDMIKKLRPNCDVIVAVMHMGVDKSAEFTSERIAKEAPGIDLIVDGHSHTTLPEGLTVGDTLIVQTGCHEHRLGQVKINLQGHKITAQTARLLTAAEVARLAPQPDRAIEKELAQMEKKNAKLLGEVIAKSDRTLTSDRQIVRRQEAELGDLCADAFRWRTGSDIAVVNGGGLRSDLPAGNVTRGDIMAIFPFGNTIQTANVPGRTIRAMLEHSVFAYPAAFGGFLEVSGLTFGFDPTRPAGQRVGEIKVNGQPLDDNKTYSLTANDFLFAGGDGYEMLKGLPKTGEFETCEEILINYLNKVGMGNIETGRISVLHEVEMPYEAPDGQIPAEQEAA